MRTIPYGRQSIDEADVKAVTKAVCSDFLTQGSGVEEFENALCVYSGAAYAVAVSSGTAALHLACQAAGIGPGDEVITSPMTFAATGNCVFLCGGRPVFADIHDDIPVINPREVEKKITRASRAIIPVNFGGHPCELEEIREIAGRRGLWVIEDNAHGIGSEYKGIPAGSCSFSDMSVFSFHPLKNITTGEGGAVLTNNRRLYERILFLRSHGIIKERRKMTRKNNPDWYYEVQESGYNYRLSDIQSALGISQLGKLGRFIEKRTELAAAYAKRLSAVEEIRLPVQRTFVKNAWNMYYIIMRSFAEREIVFESMRRAGIQVQVRYIPLYSHPYYRKRLNVKAGFFPCSQRFYRRSLVLPMYPSLKIEEVDFICGTLMKALRRLSKQGKICRGEYEFAEKQPGEQRRKIK